MTLRHVHGGNNLGYQGRAPTPFLFSGTPRAPSATGDGERHRRPSFTHLRVAPPGAMVFLFVVPPEGSTAGWLRLTDAEPARPGASPEPPGRGRLGDSTVDTGGTRRGYRADTAAGHRAF